MSILSQEKNNAASICCNKEKPRANSVRYYLQELAKKEHWITPKDIKYINAKHGSKINSNIHIMNFLKKLTRGRLHEMPQKPVEFSDQCPELNLGSLLIYAIFGKDDSSRFIVIETLSIVMKFNELKFLTSI